uniref:Uncharacterized protein n=1 Tax=Anguilla anguilla TaxID=7936 RepID=A0A0E9TMG8_ANGAN
MTLVTTLQQHLVGHFVAAGWGPIRISI